LVTETQWHNVVAWGREAAIIEKFVEKGKEVAVEGKLVHRNFTDKEGNTRYLTEVVLSELLLMNPTKKASAEA
jgi:single-strand DNA-binding protein